MFPRPLRLSLSIALAAPLLLAGCFDEQRDTTSSEAGERISLAMLQPPRSGLTPLSDDAFKLSRWSTAETLIRLDASSDPLPFLATEWEQLDGHTWRFVIRDGVSFHDGTTLTVSDVVNALTAATQAAPKPRILDGVNMTIEADGDNAVIVRTATNDPLIPNRLSSPQLAILAASAYARMAGLTPSKQVPARSY